MEQKIVLLIVIEYLGSWRAHTVFIFIYSGLALYQIYEGHCKMHAHEWLLGKTILFAELVPQSNGRHMPGEGTWLLVITQIVADIEPLLKRD